jgi:chromate reductase, NAD(P)H dehydrogenase (quinone)
VGWDTAAMTEAGGVPVSLLTISGSLQPSSVNTEVLRVAGAAVPADTVVATFARLADIPAMNPELDVDGGPEAVADFRHAVGACHGLLIVTPEYGHGMPGHLKNALDWLVGSGELSGKPVAVISASPTPTGGVRALIMLSTTLLAQAAEVVALLPIPAIRTKVDESGRLRDEPTRRRVAETIAALAEVATARRG